MAVDPTHITSSYSNTDATSYTTASISPTANRWLVIDTVSRRNPQHAAAPTISGLSGGTSLTWILELSLNDGTSDAASPGRVSRHYAWTGASPGTGTIGISWGAETSIGTAWIVYELGATTDTSDPFVQSASHKEDTATATSGTVTLAAFGSANNRPLICSYHDINEASTPEAGYTEIGDVAGTAGNLSFAAAFHGSTTDTSPSYSWTTTAHNAQIASEIKAGPGTVSWTVGMVNIGF